MIVSHPQVRRPRWGGARRVTIGGERRERQEGGTSIGTTRTRGWYDVKPNMQWWCRELIVQGRTKLVTRLATHNQGPVVSDKEVNLKQTQSMRSEISTGRQVSGDVNMQLRTDLRPTTYIWTYSHDRPEFASISLDYRLCRPSHLSTWAQLVDSHLCYVCAHLFEFRKHPSSWQALAFGTTLWLTVVV